MATVTPNFNFPVPTSTDLVKDGATAIEALGDSIDAAFVDLKGGTTGQVLAKTTNTDLDFVWVTTDDANAIQNSIVDAKGDLITATANDTPARLAVGSNGESLLADSSTATGLSYGANYAAGKNAIINGNYDVFQRGTSVTVPTATEVYLADRFIVSCNYSAGTASLSRQTFTPGSAPLSGNEATFFQRLTAGTTNTYFDWVQKIENVRTFAGKTTIFSFYAKASASTNVAMLVRQNFGSGGSANVDTSSSITLTTSFQRFTLTVNPLGSMSGKTIGTNSFLMVGMYLTGSLGSGVTIDSWGWQVEASAVATAFQTATGTIQGELAACQRYYQRISGGTDIVGSGQWMTTTTALIVVPNKVTMRTAPAISGTVTNLNVTNSTGGAIVATAVAGTVLGVSNQLITVTTAGSGSAGNGTTSFTNGASGILEMSSEL